MNIFRRLPLPRLLALCGAVLAIGISVTAIALAAGSGPTPPVKPLAQAIHDALAGSSPQGFSADITLSDKLLEGANLASGGGASSGGPESGSDELTSNPLLAGGSGRLWVSNGKARLELQAEKGDTQVIYDGTTAELYDAATNTLYRYTPPARKATVQSNGWTAYAPAKTAAHGSPSLAKIEEAIARLAKHALVSAAKPTNVGGQAAYTVRLSPKESGSLIGGAELSFDAANGTPLRAAIYSSQSSSPVVELAAGNVSYGSVTQSVFEFTPPSSAKVIELKPPTTDQQAHHEHHHGAKPDLSSHGKGLSSVWVLEEKGTAGNSKSLEGLPKVKIGGVSASELRTELGTVLTFERSGVSYVLAGAVEPKEVEALASGL